MVDYGQNNLFIVKLEGTECRHCPFCPYRYIEWFRTRVQKLNRTKGMLHWTIWDREPEVHEASIRRYGSKLVYHITVYFLFRLGRVTYKYSILTQLTYHFASYNSCPNCRPPISMQSWHRRTRFCSTLTNILGEFWITGFTDPRFPTSNCSVQHPLCHV